MTVHLVTGAFGYSGRAIAARLLEAGHSVLTLTNSPLRSNPAGGQIRVLPMSIDSPDDLVAVLDGVDVLHNTT